MCDLTGRGSKITEGYFLRAVQLPFEFFKIWFIYLFEDQNIGIIVIY